jgi:hypothetical protein
MTGKSKSETGETMIRVLQADEIDTVSGGAFSKTASCTDPDPSPIHTSKLPGWVDPDPTPLR